MDIHVVQPGDTLYELAYQYGVSMSRLIQDNQLPDPSQLVVGQTLVIQYPRSTCTVRSGDTLFSIARNAGIPLRQLLRNNPGLEGATGSIPDRSWSSPISRRSRGRSPSPDTPIPTSPPPCSSGRSPSSAALLPSPTGPPSAEI